MSAFGRNKAEAAIPSIVAPDLHAPVQAGSPGFDFSLSPLAQKLAKPRVKHGATKEGNGQQLPTFPTSRLGDTICPGSFCIVVRGLRGRWNPGARNKPALPCPSVWRNLAQPIEILD